MRSTPARLDYGRRAAQQRVDVNSLNLTQVAAKAERGVNVAISAQSFGGQMIPNTRRSRCSGWAWCRHASGRIDGSGKLTLVAPKSKKAGQLTATITNVAPPAKYRYAPILFPANSVTTTLN